MFKQPSLLFFVFIVFIIRLLRPSKLIPYLQKTYKIHRIKPPKKINNDKFQEGYLTTKVFFHACNPWRMIGPPFYHLSYLTHGNVGFEDGRCDFYGDLAIRHDLPMKHKFLIIALNKPRKIVDCAR